MERGGGGEEGDHGPPPNTGAFVVGFFVILFVLCSLWGGTVACGIGKIWLYPGLLFGVWGLVQSAVATSTQVRASHE
jgi:hypothetical protein